ncbi:CLOCK-interacting pacemaker a [Salminus brasiliensis]|uniref:CLOCK-interacting pacemaker a n=1 Tax=Salminus brasiliensis TaxID=930266 RepID=UPI003B839BCB
MANKHKVSKSELEGDSGFSDASSGYLSAVDQEMFEDVRSSTSTAHHLHSGPLLPLVPESYQDVSPMFRMNNIVVKQPGPLTPALKPWGFNQSLELVPQSPVVLLQPVMPSSNCTSLTPASQQRQSKNYIPILNSFLKIAPHPAHGVTRDLETNSIHKSSSGHRHAGKRRHNDKQSRSSSLKQDVSESTTVGSRSADSSMFSHSLGNMDSSPQLPALQETSGSTTPFSVCSDGYPSPFPEASPKDSYTSSDDAENFSESLSPSFSKRKRFCNTYNILNRSGLLGITMRTKELIRQNKRSQAQLQKLQAHTDLFLEAMSSRDPQVWAKLQLTIQNPSSEESKEDTVGNLELDTTAIDCM